jgi:hypothetical protein
MTPRVDKDFSQELLDQLHSAGPTLDFRQSASLFPVTHPLVLKAQISHRDNPQQEYAFQGSFLSWNLFCFENKSEIMSDVKLIKAHPFVIAEILKSTPTEVALDYEQLGCVILTQNKMLLPTSPGLHQQTLPVILNYTFSQDLWAAHGKWTQFHQRLQKAFENAGLLLDSLPGFYSLNKKAFKLKEFGFLGDEKGHQFDLTFPWTFPLSELVKLEKLLTQEF